MERQAKTNWDQEISPQGQTGLQYMCDLCDHKTSLESIRRTEEPVYLCPHCYTLISGMPEGKIKYSMMRFLLRNVL